MNQLVQQILRHTDNHLDITAEWLESVGAYTGDETTDRVEYEVTIQAVDTRSNTQLHETHGYEWEETTVLGYNINTKDVYIEVYGDTGGGKPFATDTIDCIVLPPIQTRLEFRLLLLAHKAWGYNGQ